MSNIDSLLPFEQFIERQNNFYMHFMGEDRNMARIYRQGEHYRRCVQAEPKLASLAARLQTLYEGASSVQHDGFQNPEFQRGLYEAYLLMRPHVEKDWELFR